MADGDSAAAYASPRSPAPPETPSTQKRRQRGLVSRVWKGIFGRRENVEKLLQALSKEEEALRSRVQRRARASRSSAHNVLALASALEIVAVGYAIMTTRSPDIPWQMRAARVLPMFLVPVLAALIYSAITSITKILDNRDQHTLEKLRAERQTKIDELKERTNYYTTQQLIQVLRGKRTLRSLHTTVLTAMLSTDHSNTRTVKWCLTLARRLLPIVPMVTASKPAPALRTQASAVLLGGAYRPLKNCLQKFLLRVT